MSNDCDHYLYVMAKWEGKDPTSPVKIGISASPESRLLSIQTACPFPVRMICHLTAMVEARVSSKDLHQDIFEVSGVTEVQNWIDSLLK